MSETSSTPFAGSREKPIRFHRVERNGECEDYPSNWTSYAQLMRNHDERLVVGWKEEIDTLLVFAGLFSAIVTAFNIEAYKLLQDDPAQISIQLLQQISTHLARGAIMNSTTGEGTDTLSSRAPFRPSTQSVRINALWFSSLVCALFSALLGILVKQWLREYLAIVPLSSRDAVRLRQHRYEGLITWRVPEIMAFLPILLEIALILFLLGLVDFLLMLQSTVATIVTSVVALALLFYATTTIAPLLSPHCPFKSPQSWILVQIRKTLFNYMRGFRSKSRDSTTSRSVPHFTNWSDRDNAITWTNRHELDLKAVTWINTSFVDEDTQASLISVIPVLRPDHAAQLVFTVLAGKVHLPTNGLIDRVRARSCSEILREASVHFDRSTRTRMTNMLLKLLEYVPRDHDPTKPGALDVLWTLWELCLGACMAEEQDSQLYQSVLNGMAELLSEGEPFRLRRAALSLLYESTHTWTYLYCPSAIGNIISFARSCYLHHLPDIFVKAAAVALFLSPGLDWDDDEAMPHHRQELKELLRDLARFLQQCNEDGTKYDARSAGKLVGGITALAEKDADLIEDVLAQLLLEGDELGLLDLSQDEWLLLNGLQEKRRVIPDVAQPGLMKVRARAPISKAG